MIDAAAPGRAPPVRWQPATITKIIRRTPRVISFFFRPATPFSWRPGQHADVRLTAPDGYIAQRSYSIANIPEDGEEVELAIERLDDGEVSSFFHDVAAVGEIELKGPLGGHFVWTVKDGGPLLLVGGGSGVVPLTSMLRHRAAQNASVPAALLYSSRNWDEVIFRDELLALEARDDGFALTFAITREPARRARDLSRRIEPVAFRTVLSGFPAAPAHAFVCGNNAFVSTAADALVAAGVAPERIRTERYGQ